MPTTRRSRRLAEPPERVWAVVGDPHQLPRWWPRVARVEAVGADGSFTEVLESEGGKRLRADFHLLAHEGPAPGRVAVRRFSQALAGTPFERILARSEIEIALRPEGEATEVVLTLEQDLYGFFSRFGSFMVRRAARQQLEQALDGLEALVG